MPATTRTIQASPSSARRREDGFASERQVSIKEAKASLSRLLAEVEAGTTIVITRRGKPIATLEARRSQPRRVAGALKGLISIDDRFFEPLPDDELKAWEGECDF